MAKNTSIQSKNPKIQFIQGKTSRFEATPPSVPYYQRLRHVKRKEPLPNQFLNDFNSQINPTILPGTPLPIKTFATFRLLTETEFNLLTELGDNLRTE